MLFTLFVSILFGTVIYTLLSTRHQAIIKTKLSHTFHLVDNKWNSKEGSSALTLLSPTFTIDGIYKSMEGPKASQIVRLNESGALYFITRFNIKAVAAENREDISKEFICHMNMDVNDKSYHSNLGLPERIGLQYPRVTSLSSGFENYSYPKGYGFPIQGNEPFTITTQALNHNHKDIHKAVKHLITLDYEAYNGTQQPLLSKTVYIQLPYDKYNPFKAPLDPNSDQCIPVETKNHSYANADGVMFSGHWVIPTGTKTYHSSITNQLQIQDSLRLHFAAIHVHPFATSIQLYDTTTQENIFTSKIENYTDRIGLQNVEAFSSEKGTWLYANHNYELVLEVNNTTSINQDMMGSMFLFFYDKELDELLRKAL